MLPGRPSAHIRRPDRSSQVFPLADGLGPKYQGWVVLYPAVGWRSSPLRRAEALGQTAVDLLSDTQRRQKGLEVIARLLIEVGPQAFDIPLRLDHRSTSFSARSELPNEGKVRTLIELIKG